jgi:glucose/arabinose dehydrogenase
MPRPVLLALLASALLAGCGAAGSAGAPTPAPAPTDVIATAAAAEPTTPPAAPTTAPPSDAGAAPPADLAALGFRLEPVLDGFDQPTHVTGAGDGSGRLFVAEQAGRIWAVRDGERLAEPFLDIADLVGSQGNEQGLLSVAFHPRFAENGRLFVDYTDRNGDSVVAEYRVAADNPDRADPAGARQLLAVEQPAANHNGGLLKFGPDGMLYIGFGDGGAAGDPWGNGQRLDTLLGKILRVDVDGGEPYAIPDDNPFAGRDGARPEIWAYGLRNPWRFSFDRETGDLYIADVGQNAQEEVHFQPASSAGGENYGWNTMEGDACFRAADCDRAGLTLPVAVYPHSGEGGGCSVTGGYAYRGASYPQIAGVYLYTDFCSGNLWALTRAGDAWQSQIVGKLDIRTSSFGEDDAGELLLVDRDGGGLYRLVIE